MRILIGLTVMADSYFRLFDLVPHYTDIGILPRSALMIYQNPWHLSLFHLTGNGLIVLILFLITIFFGFLLMIGYRTKLSSILCWLLVLSIFFRNPLVVHGGDVFFKIILLWGIFLPWGIRYSLDSYLSSVKVKSNTISTAASFGYFIQIICLYFFAGLYKLRPVWLIEGNGVYYSLMYIPFQTPFGRFLLQFPWIYKSFSYITVFFELIVSWLLVFPFKGQIIRTVAVLLLIFMHISFGLAIELGLFSLYVISALVGLLPGWFWDQLEKFHTITQRSSWLDNNLRGVGNLYHLIGSKSVKIIKNLTKKKLISAPINYPVNLQLSKFTRIFLFFLAVYIVLINITGIRKLRIPLPTIAMIPGYFLGVNQKWTLFAYPYQASYLLYVEGITESGRTVELVENYSHKNLNYHTFSYSSYPNHRWKKMAESVLRGSFRKEFADYNCRLWKKNSSDNLKEVYLIQRKVPVNFDSTYATPVDTVIFNYDCQDKRSLDVNQDYLKS